MVAFARQHLNHRMCEDMGSVLDYLFYQGENPLLQINDPDGVGGNTAVSVTQRYMHVAATDEVLADEQSTGPMWHLADHENTPRDIILNDQMSKKEK